MPDFQPPLGRKVKIKPGRAYSGRIGTVIELIDTFAIRVQFDKIVGGRAFMNSSVELYDNYDKLVQRMVNG
jgi:hypothetical protein